MRRGKVSRAPINRLRFSSISHQIIIAYNNLVSKYSYKLMIWINGELTLNGWASYRALLRFALVVLANALCLRGARTLPFCPTAMDSPRAPEPLPLALYCVTPNG